MRFEFATATRIIFGEGTAATLPELARSFGVRPLVVTGASTRARGMRLSRRSRRRPLLCPASRRSNWCARARGACRTPPAMSSIVDWRRQRH